MAELIKLPGVARKTANIVLASAYKKAEGIAVDTHVKRLAGRLGLSQERQPEKIEKDLMAIVPGADWLDFNFLFVEHGRKICQAKNRAAWSAFSRSFALRLRNCQPWPLERERRRDKWRDTRRGFMTGSRASRLNAGCVPTGAG